MERLDVFVEGVSSLVDYKGPVADIINGFARGLRSAISYCGARNVQEIIMDLDRAPIGLTRPYHIQ